MSGPSPCHLLLANALLSPLGWQKSLDILQKGLNFQGARSDRAHQHPEGSCGRCAAGSPALTFPLGPPPPPPLGLASELPAQPAGPSAAAQHGRHGRDAGSRTGRESFRNQFPPLLLAPRARLPPRREPRLLLRTGGRAHFFGRSAPAGPLPPCLSDCSVTCLQPGCEPPI